MYGVIKRTVAIATLVVAMAAIFAPIASARFDVSPATANNSGANSAPFELSSTAPASSSSSSGFDWGDAAIGAAAVVTALGLGTAATMMVRRSHAQRPATS
jgi:hypothetical protein